MNRYLVTRATRPDSTVEALRARVAELQKAENVKALEAAIKDLEHPKPRPTARTGKPRGKG